MDIIKKLIFKDLQLNKKRTIVTIIGIILSTALICAVAGMVTSVQKTLVENAKKDDGNYHVTLYDVPKNDIKVLQNNRNVEQTYLLESLGYSYLKESKNEYKPYLSLMAVNDFKNIGINLVSGRLPENSNEIVIEESIIQNGKVDYKVGQKLKLDIGKRISEGKELNQRNPYNEEQKEYIETEFSNEYTIVGIIERTNRNIEPYSAPGYTVITKMDEVKNKANVAIRYKNKYKFEEYTAELNEMKVADNSIKSEEQITVNGMRNTYKSKKYDLRVNNILLSYEGASFDDGLIATLCSIAGVVIVIIIVSSVFVIRNSFAISITEKMKQYGMLSSIGATSKQIKKSVLFEGAILGIIAIPLGIISGIIAIAVLLWLVNILLKDSLNGIKFLYCVPIIPILLTVILSAITIYLSSISSARKASKISPIEAIRSNQDIKIKAKKIRCPKIISKIFGIGGEISYKNLKRNRKKYRTTIISIIVSVVIFISLSTFIGYGFKMSGLYYQELSYNMGIFGSKNIEFYKEISKMNNIKEYSIHIRGDIEIVDKENKYLTDFAKDKAGYEYSNYETLTISIHSVGNEEYERYVKKLGGNLEKYKNGAILVNEGLAYYDGKQVFGDIYNIKTGDKLNIKDSNNNTKELQIVYVTNKKPMGLDDSYSNTGYLIVSDEFMQKLNLKETVKSMYINSSNATQLENDIKNLINIEGKKEVLIDNLEQTQKQLNSMVLVISIFLYGFIAVITLIGITNIFNTITTNMNLRSKEFAMLKSVGMTSKEFKRMIRLENIFYGLKALIIGIPIGIGMSYLIYNAFSNSIQTNYIIPIKSIIISIIFVFVIIGIIMRFAIKKINKQNIIETIRNDNI